MGGFCSGLDGLASGLDGLEDLVTGLDGLEDFSSAVGGREDVDTGTDPSSISSDSASGLGDIISSIFCT